MTPIFSIFALVASFTFVAGLPSGEPQSLPSIFERQGAGRRSTELVGNGNPHQNFKNVQITGTLRCDSAETCTKVHAEGESVNVGFEAGVTPVSWINGGFSVSKSFSTEQASECQAVRGQAVCVWQRIAYTAYTVRNVRCSTNGCFKDGEPYVIKSPNKGQTEDYCVVNACRGIGQGYWEKTSIAGGP
ncbi:hypothetical protein CB0940_06712 [Cercospora beticola]|uniref:Secreted protein n=1 Tax=Cercospora beticola TaxID=122368 RepID=A0A2G5H989_CERBT|nr:hypothetical protein CB0940_06712 [Cercospora beticola]PIA89108.1 hypothetical protein CB0940_06712 [Cercospora beticola]WPB02611.1 hypothetical protein RHO25_007247 [Cercospora beticola]CAK1358725.1 unnamed protein product [Cercospora beticola]